MELRPLDFLAVGLGCDGRYAFADTHDRVTVTNTGGLVVTAAPVLKVNLYDELWLVTRAQIPFATQLFGEQSVGASLFAGVQYTFQ